MVEDYNELSPDLEWMLQSNQVDDATLIEVLVRDYYEPIFRLALDCLTYPEQAHRVTQDTFIMAISGEKKFRGEMHVSDWLADIAKEICQERREKIAAQRVLNPRLIDSIRRREFAENLSVRQLEAAKKTIHAKIRSKNVSLVQRARFKEILLLSGAFVIAFLLIRYINSAVTSLSSLSENDQSFSASQMTADATLPEPISTASPSSSSTDAFPAQPPLTLNSTHDDIWKRILISRNLWNNLWADVWVVLHGPSNYLGPPRAERHQIWLDQDIGGIHLSGLLEGRPDHVERIPSTIKGPESTSFFAGTEYFSKLGSQVPWFYLSSEKILSTPYIASYLTIANYGYPPQGVWYTVVDELEWAGRKTVIVDLTDDSGILLARYWLDALTGLALKEQYPGIQSPDKILLEVQVSKIEFDVSFPLSLSRATDDELLGRGFAQDYTGLPEPRISNPTISPYQAFSSRISPPLSPPSIDFDPSQSWLSFAGAEDPLQRQEGNLLHIFGDSSYLGNIAISDPFSTICNRSTDGRKIVLTQWPESSTEASSIITFDLDDLNQKEYVIPETYIIHMAYSPDSGLIAISGISPNEDRSGVYIIDTFTDETMPIPGMEDILSLSWSPDGSQLASLRWFTNWMYSQPNLDISLFNLETGELTSLRFPSNLPWEESTVKIPLGDWEASFHLPLEGLEPCGAPPNAHP